MSSDLVKRLRNEAEIYASYDATTEKLLVSAADRIKALQAALAQAEAERDGAHALLVEYPKWLACVENHASDSTTDLLIERIERQLEGHQHD
jgi:hypothetical protein